MITASASERWFRYVNAGVPGTPAIHLICFSHAGGSAAAYKDWQACFDDSVRLLPVQLPFRENRLSEAMPDQLCELVRTFVDEQQALLHQPYALFGHSLGAVLAYETACRVRDCGCPPPRALFVSGTRFPSQKIKPEPPYNRAETERYIKQLTGTDPQLMQSRIFMDYFLPIIQADLNLYRRYIWSPRPALSCPIKAYGGSADPYTPPGRLRSWGEATTDFRGCGVYPGAHFYLRHCCRELAADLSELLRAGGMDRDV